MNKFKSPLLIRVVPRWQLPFTGCAQLYELAASFTFVSDQWGEITAPIGFLTDFGSVPSIAKFYIDDDDPDLLYGSLPHDWLYKNKGDLGDGRKLSRLDADNVLREAMLACGSPPNKVQSVFWAVRSFGGRNWRN